MILFDFVVGISASSHRQVQRRPIWTVSRTKGVFMQHLFVLHSCTLFIFFLFRLIASSDSTVMQELEEVGGLQELEKEINRRIKLSKKL